MIIYLDAYRILTCTAIWQTFTIGGNQIIDFVVHDEGDSVGVVVVEGVKAGDVITGWVMDQNLDIEFEAASDIPIGHKLAIKPMR